MGVLLQVVLIFAWQRHNPMDAPLYFYKRYDQLIYPTKHKPKSKFLELTKEKRRENIGCLGCLSSCCSACLENDDCCCSCTGVDSSDIPPWMLVQVFFFTVGGTAACSTDEQVLENRAKTFYLENTRRFYIETYREYGSITSFDELLQVKLKERGVCNAPGPWPFFLLLISLGSPP